MWKERQLWSNVGLKPWESPSISINETSGRPGWYRTSLYGPADALIAADTAGAYAITDRSTLLRQTAQQTVKNITVLFEPETADHILLNTCYALRPVMPRSADVEAESSKFLDFLTGPDGQKVISDFGRSEAGFSFFAASEDGCAKTQLKGGRPISGKWCSQTSELALRR